MNKQRSLFQRLGWALYVIIGVIALALFVLHLYLAREQPVSSISSSVSAAILNLSTELLAIALVFFIVEQMFKWNSDEERQGEILGELKRIGSVLDEKELKLTPYPTRQAIYDSSISTLRSEQWRKLRIFAPVGLWREDNEKRAWLTAVADYARAGKVETVWAVFGLPPISKGGNQRRREEVLEDLNYARSLLNGFDGQKTLDFTSIRRLLPP